MAWTTVDKVRRISGLKSSDVSNADLISFIEDAQVLVRDDIITKIYKEKLTGSIDGSNTVFLTKYSPIMDKDFDMVVDANDVDVWGTKTDDTTGEETYTSLTVSSVNSLGGGITLTTAPDSTTYDFIIADYDYFPHTINWDLISEATAFMAAHLVMMNLEGVYPSKGFSYTIGKRHVRRTGADLSKTDNIDKFYWQYKQVISKIRSLINHTQDVPYIKNVTELV